MSVLAPCDLVFAHGDHDHAAQEVHQKNLTQFLENSFSEISRIQNDSSLSDREKMLRASLAIVNSLPDLEAKDGFGIKKSLKQLGRSIVNLPLGVLNAVKQATIGTASFVVQPDSVNRINSLLSSLKRKGYNRISDLWHREGMMATLFVATMISTTYPPYTVVTEAGESVVVGPAHIWCLYFQYKYVQGVNFMLRYVDKFRIFVNYFVRNGVFTYGVVMEDLYAVDALNDETTNILTDSEKKEMKDKLRGLSQVFLKLPNMPFLKKLWMASGKMETYAKGRYANREPMADRLLKNTTLKAMLWRDNLMMVGETLKSLIESRYDDAIHHLEERESVSNDAIHPSYRMVLNQLNDRLLKIQSHYTKWVTSKKEDRVTAELLEKSFFIFAQEMMGFDPSIHTPDLLFKTSRFMQEANEKAQCQLAFENN